VAQNRKNNHNQSWCYLILVSSEGLGCNFFLNSLYMGLFFEHFLPYLGPENVGHANWVKKNNDFSLLYLRNDIWLDEKDVQPFFLTWRRCS